MAIELSEIIERLELADMEWALYRAIDGRGAFRRFKNQLYRFGLEKEWYQFRDKYFEQIAREWCLENDVPLVED